MLALGIFLFQTQNSMYRYYTGPIVEEKIYSTINETKQPIIYVCHMDQFNYKTASAHGYGNEGQMNFMIGKLKDTRKVSWKGKDENITFEEMFDSDYNSFHSYNSETKQLYLVDHGICKKITQNSSKMYIKTNKSTVVLLVDPYLDSEFLVREMNDGRLYLGPTTDNLYDSSSYMLEYRYHDSKIFNGQSCTDYEKFGSSYGNCIESIMKKYLLESYGCLPPWFPKPMGLTCETERDVYDYKTVPYKEVYSNFKNILLGRNIKMFDVCLPPCLKMSIKPKRAYHSTSSRYVARLSFFTQDEVVVMKSSYSYNIFNIVVDIGSALGLWLGLSALCILDKIIQFCKLMFEKKKFNINHVKFNN